MNKLDIKWELAHYGYNDLAYNDRVVNAIAELFVDCDGEDE